ncbi:HPr kinase/phosphorylase [Methylobacterium persicinum]|uniref:Serine kinase of HPr protein (Carbohydrate metabolism regulator) n=1 Tax=Methylobacterium persicinum TaxID=374426 RepID=A0ABU0HFF7_9HYPH|nr:HPr kinase/phosphatase C-terminal domain-containing protein [Methylobacterium persicinum]MDQ0441048.1 serine kinase of HPr protein (carbohydrate metabolism regulator) [Methylobacterium persicinum]GJE40055.1 HPr kinase/phosphorylase [Methylobacterium persicinum]
MESLHAACVALGDAGVLIRGPSGSGKSTLALQLADRTGAALVADDRVRVAVEAGRLIARPHPGEAGRVEIRGQGLLTVRDLGLPTRPEAALALAIDLVDTAPRLPDPPEDARILGMTLPCLVLDRSVRTAGLAPLLVCAALRRREA